MQFEHMGSIGPHNLVFKKKKKKKDVMKSSKKTKGARFKLWVVGFIRVQVGFMD